jgi:membrane protein implicated in regulation of membrane protease activity
VSRAEVSFWILTAVTTLAVGGVALTLTAPASLATHLQLAANLILLAASTTLLTRVLRHLTRTPQTPPDGPT